MTKNFNGTAVTVNGVSDITDTEIKSYIARVKETADGDVTAISISPAKDGKIALDYKVRPPKFERIRRITGYLVGTIDRWNNAKRAEEHDRVKHALAV